MNIMHCTKTDDVTSFHENIYWEGDYLIIGAGAAGVQLAYFMHKSNDNYLLLEAGGQAGVFWNRFPRHRKMISINKVNNGYTDPDALLRWDWNSLICDDSEFRFSNYTTQYFPDADTFQNYLSDFSNRFELIVRYNTKVRLISRTDERFKVVDTQGNCYIAKRLIVATGVTLPYIPQIQGIENTDNYTDASLDAQEYVGQTVLIIGKGTSAFEVANHLIETTRVIHMCSPESIRLAWASHFVGHLRAINTPFLDTYLLKGQNSVLNAWIDKIDYDGKEFLAHIRFPNADNQTFVMAYDRVITCTGFQFDSSIFSEECKPELTKNNRLPAMNNEWESTNVKDLYFAGTLMQVLDYQKTHSSVIHGFRFNIVAMHWMLRKKYQAIPIPFKKVAYCANALAARVIHRISTDAGMFQQQGFMGDVIVVDKDMATIKYYQNLPIQYVHSSEISQHSHYYVITLEFGHSDHDPFSIPREKDPNKANEDFYLHPMIKRFNFNDKVCEHHVPEHLENDWRPNAFPGNRPLIREIEYTGQSDHTQFQQLYQKNLAEFFQKELDKHDY